MVLLSVVLCEEVAGVFPHYEIVKARDLFACLLFGWNISERSTSSAIGPDKKRQFASFKLLVLDFEHSVLSLVALFF